MSVLDLSNHDFPTFDAACLKVQGVERVILGCWNFPIAERMLLDLRANGIACEDLYAFLYYRLPWENNDILNATELARRHGGVTRIWLDCESGSDGPGGSLDTEADGTTVGDRVRITRSYYLSLNGLGYSPGIYTGQYWWKPKMGDSTFFADSGAPLWLANYGMNDPDNPRGPITGVSFGGWTDVAAHQYSSTIPVCGRGRDHNYWFIEEDALKLTELQTENLLLRVFAGSEYEGVETREQRLQRALGELEKAETVQSVNDTAASAMAVALAGGGGGGQTVPDHLHEQGGVAR